MDNSEEGSPDYRNHHYHRGGYSRRPVLCILKWKGGVYEIENIAPNPGHTFAGVAKSFLRIGGQFCRGCINPPQNWGNILQGLQKPAPELGEDFAGVA